MLTRNVIYICVLTHVMSTFCLDNYGNIELFPYNQSNSITECREGLVLDKDQLIVYGQAQFDNIFENGTIIFILGFSQPKSMCEMSIKDCNKRIDRSCYCVMKETNAIQLVLNLTVDNRIDELMLTAQLQSVNIDQVIVSQNITLPDVLLKRCSKPTFENCPELVEEGEFINCTCELDFNTLSASDNNDTVEWSSEKHHNSINGRTLLFQSSREMNFEIFHCTVVPDNSNGILYSPMIIVKPEDVNCNTTSHDDIQLKITCVAEKVYPVAQCQISFQNNETDVSNVSSQQIMYDHVKINEDPDLYATFCIAYIGLLSSGTYTLTISVFPYHREFTIDELFHYAVNKSLVFIKGKNERKPQG